MREEDIDIMELIIKKMPERTGAKKNKVLYAKS